MSHSYSFYLFIFAVALVPFVIGQELTVGTPLTNQSLQANATTQYSFSVPSYCNNIIIQVNQTNTFAQGDPDLYISTIQNWPQYGKAWISDAYGSDFRVIPFDDVDYVTGTYYLNVVNYCDPVNVSCAPITFDILILLEETTNPENTQVTIDADGVYNQSICIPNNCTIFRITAVALDDIGDPDLYASNTVSNPNIYKNYLWVSAVNGSSQPEYLSVSNADPEYTAGAYYIVLHNFCSTGNDCGNSTFNLTVETFQAETCPPVIASEGNNGTDLTSGQPLINLTLVSQTYSDPYRIFVPDICQDLHVEVTQTNTPGNGDPDLYISKLNLYPTYGKAWSSVATGSENFTLSHADPDYQSGWFYLYTYNYCDNKTISCTNITYDLVASVLPLNESVHNSNQPSLILASQNVYNATICASSGSPGICVKVAPRSGNPFLYATNTNSNVLPTTALWISDSAGPNQTETLFISNQDPQFTLGTYWIAIFNGGENMDANLTISSTLTREECFGPEESTTGTAGTSSGNASGTSGSTSGSSGNQGSTSVPESFTTGKNDHAKESSGNKVTVIGVAVVAIATLIVAIV